jgi:hypothetical protein
MPSRRRLLKMIAGADAVGVCGWALATAGRGNAYYRVRSPTTPTARVRVL